MAAAIVTLKHPIQFGETLIETLEVKPTGRALRDFTLPMEGDKVDFQPFKLAVVGLKMSGHIAGAEKIADMMHPGDMRDLAIVVLGFFDGAA